MENNKIAHPFTWVTIDISGVCNAKCKYCATGSGSANPGKIMSLDLFKRTLDRAIEIGAADPSFTAGVALFNKGEPFLNPQFTEILDYIVDKGFKISLSSNCSVNKPLTKRQVEACTGVLVSVPGWSQESYDRVHKLNFEQVKENIAKLAANFKKYKMAKKINMTYHLYQNNLNELTGAIEFAQKLGIDFNPYYAHIIDYWKIKDYVEGTCSKELLDDINSSVFISNLKNGLSNVPSDYECPQHLVLNIDENANILTCCVLPNNHPEYSKGNLFDDNAIELINNRQKHNECAYCKKSGISKLLTTYVGTPHFVRELEKYVKLKNRFKFRIFK